jgi:hypothetical protein
MLNQIKSNRKSLSYSLDNTAKEVKPGYGKDGHAFKE